MARRNPETLVSKAAEETTELSLAKAKREISALKAKHRKAVSWAVEVDKQLSTLLDISNVYQCGQRKKFRSLKSSKANGAAIIVPGNDWHVEEEVIPESVSGKNSFDLDVAEDRIRRFYSKIVELIDWQMKFSPIVELWHPLLGDLITGYIHEELVESNSLSPTEACVFLIDMICPGIELLLKETKLPIFIPTCVGNHGRTTPRKRIKTGFRNSFEWLLYSFLSRKYEDNPRVAWHVGTGYHNTHEIVGRKIRFHHGDGLRYQGGVGGITIPVNKSIAQWDKVSPVDLDIFGHWHTALWHYNKWVSCGSLIGYSEYSVEIKAEFQHPTQMFIVIDRSYGATHVHPIFLTKPWRDSGEEAQSIRKEKARK